MIFLLISVLYSDQSDLEGDISKHKIMLYFTLPHKRPKTHKLHHIVLNSFVFFISKVLLEKFKQLEFYCGTSLTSN